MGIDQSVEYHHPGWHDTPYWYVVFGERIGDVDYTESKHVSCRQVTVRRACPAWKVYILLYYW